MKYIFVFNSVLLKNYIQFISSFTKEITLWSTNENKITAVFMSNHIVLKIDIPFQNSYAYDEETQTEIEDPFLDLEENKMIPFKFNINFKHQFLKNNNNSRQTRLSFQDDSFSISGTVIGENKTHILSYIDEYQMNDAKSIFYKLPNTDIYENKLGSFTIPFDEFKNFLDKINNKRGNKINFKHNFVNGTEYIDMISVTSGATQDTYCIKIPFISTKNHVVDVFSIDAKLIECIKNANISLDIKGKKDNKKNNKVFNNIIFEIIEKNHMDYISAYGIRVRSDKNNSLILVYPINKHMNNLDID